VLVPQQAPSAAHHERWGTSRPSQAMHVDSKVRHMVLQCSSLLHSNAFLVCWRSWAAWVGVAARQVAKLPPSPWCVIVGRLLGVVCNLRCASACPVGRVQHGKLCFAGVGMGLQQRTSCTRRLAERACAAPLRQIHPCLCVGRAVLCRRGHGATAACKLCPTPHWTCL
jgi:hypothetical protein